MMLVVVAAYQGDHLRMRQHKILKFLAPFFNAPNGVMAHHDGKKMGVPFKLFFEPAELILFHMPQGFPAARLVSRT